MTLLLRSRRPVAIVALACPSLLAGCVESPACVNEHVPGEEAVYTFDLATYNPGATPSTLHIVRDTLVFPLARDTATQSPTAEAPGDLVVRYTRVGCWLDDPGPHIADTVMRDVPPVHLTRITIDQASDGEDPPPSGGACFAYRTCDGTWSTQFAPTETSIHGSRSRAIIDLDVVGADAAAIFLPPFTEVAEVTFTAE